MRSSAAWVSVLVVAMCGACAGRPTRTAPPAKTAQPQVATAPVVTPAEPPPPAGTLPGTWDEKKRAAHVLERMAYGPRPGDIDAVAKRGVEEWIRAQLHPETLPDDAVEAKLAALASLAMSAVELHVAFPGKQGKKRRPASAVSPAAPPKAPRELERELATAKLVRAIESERQFQEVMVDFWFNHFNVFAKKGADKWLVVPYEHDVLRPRVFGKFRDLLGAVAHSPAMLFYLDNWLSKADGLNENYGRELLELHTLGVDGGYTQDDVREVARAFTGWSIAEPRGEARFAFHPKKHDAGAKTILGHRFPGAGGKDGVKEGEEVLDLIASHPATARFIARKLCAKLVADEPPKELVEHVADVFTKTGGDLRATYEAIVRSPAFWEDSAFGAKVKTPLEVAASGVRAVGGRLDVTAGGALVRWVARMGEPLYGQAPPTGYKESADAWVGTGALVERIDFGVALAQGRIRGVASERAAMVEGVKAGDDAALLDELAGAILARPLTQPTRDVILAELARRSAAASGITYQEGARSSVPLVIGLLLGSPEFQHQ